MRKFLGRMIPLCMFFLLFSVSVFAAPASDASSWAREQVEKAYYLGIVPDDLMQKCKKNITRKEFCELSMQFYGVMTGKSGTTMSPSPFYDEASPYVVKAAELGVVRGVTDVMFMPDDPLMREQLAAYTMKALEVCDMERPVNEIKYQISFYDGNQISDFAIDPIRFLVSQGILNGYDGYFYPKGFVTVEQAISMFLNAYEQYRMDVLQIGKIGIRLDEEEASVLSKLGKPERIDTNIFGFDRYIYHNEAGDFIMIGIEDGLVREMFTNAEKFVYGNLNSSMGGYGLIGTKEKYAIDVVDNYRVIAQVGVDPLDNGAIDSIYVRDKRLALDYSVYGKQLAEDASQELFEMINAARIRRGISPFVWDETIAEIAEDHSIEMGQDAKITYENAEGESPFDRMKKAGIRFALGAEMISADKGGPIQIYQHWMGAIGNNKNLMDEKLTHCGIGTVISGFRVIATMDLYSK